MDVGKISVYIIVGLVMFGLPVLLGRLTGSNPMELLFGDLVNRTRFGKKKKDGEEAAGNDAGGDAVNTAGKAGRKGNAKDGASQKNSSRQELMETISGLMTYATKYHFFCIVPGTLMHGDEVASLAVLLVTRKSVIGFNCFGYGGTICPGNGDEDWKQILNGEETSFASPVVKNRAQKEILDAVLKENGYPDIYTEVFGVFTASGVTLKDNNSRKTYCCSQKVMMDILKGNRYMESRGVDPQKVGRMLEAHTKKAPAKPEQGKKRKDRSKNE